MMRSLFIAIQFLTRLPTPRLENILREEIGHSVYFYPVVGFIIGLNLNLLALILGGMPDSLLACIILLAWILLTGGLHLDGLADSADAWLGGHGDKDKTLSIMKDPASGPAGVISILIVLLIKYQALILLLGNQQWLALLLTPVLGRSSILLLFHGTPYVRSGGLGEALAEYYSRRTGNWILAVIGIITVLLLGITGFAIIFAMLVMIFYLRSLMLKRIAGTTGDTAGAMIEICEALILIVAASLL